MIQHTAQLSAVPGNGSIVVDGHDLSNITRGFTFTASVDEMPRLTVHLDLVDVIADGEVRCDVPPETREALIALGWTPPEES